jgi:NADH-quinone oxidoreductase subunit M
MRNRLHLPFFYGWLLVAIGFVTMAVGVNARTAFSLLFPPILDDFGWDRGATAGIFSFGFLASALVTPFVGRLMDRRGPVFVVELGVVAMAAVAAAVFITLKVSGGFSHAFQLIVFAAVGLGFAVKVPMWPFHTWLPDAHTEAPTIGSVLLAGVMLKMGGYGFIRIALPILPYGAQKYAPWIGLLAAIAIVYAALACLAQKDLKRLIAFSSVGHMGFVMLGIATLTTIGINAAIFGMVAHGLITGMLFFCVGSLYDRYHTREIAEIGGGVMQKLPYLGGVFAFVAIASLGLPGLAGFWGEVMALLSSFSPAQSLSTPLFRGFMIAGGIGTILTAGYFLWMLQRVNMGTLPEKWKSEVFGDIAAVEWVSWVPLLVGIVALGLFPSLLTDVTQAPVNSLLGLFGA